MGTSKKAALTVALNRAPYVDDVFAVSLFNGINGTQTITNGLDLVGRGGMVWSKFRTLTTGHSLVDTVRGGGKLLASNGTAAQASSSLNVPQTFLSSGFTFADNAAGGATVAWAFRRARRFFDVVVWTSAGTLPVLQHNLGAEPGLIVAKAVSGTSDWFVYHRGNGAGSGIVGLSLNTQIGAGASNWTAAHTTTTFATASVASSAGAYPSVNGVQYVAYLFAHDVEADGVIQCGRYTGNGQPTGPAITLGWEPQFLLVKAISSSTTNWVMADTMRGFQTSDYSKSINANDVVAESASAVWFIPNPRGFSIQGTANDINAVGHSYLYLAIRRPNKPPTAGDQILNIVTRTGTAAVATVNTPGLNPDVVISRVRSTTGNDLWFTRLRGPLYNTTAVGTPAEASTAASVTGFDVAAGYTVGTASAVNQSGQTFVNWCLARRAGAVDVVEFTGDGVNGRSVPHNLGAVPTFIITFPRSSGYGRPAYHRATGGNAYLYFGGTGTTATGMYPSTPTATGFTVDTAGAINGSGIGYTSILFGDIPGLCKAFSYSGGTPVNLGFVPRFIIVKNATAASAWYILDTARGIVSGNDPILSPGLTAAESSASDFATLTATGFQPVGNLTNAGTFIGWACA